MRWFDSLKADSINSFKKLTQAFSSHFITCNRVRRPLSSLLSLSMREGETLKTYFDRYWEMYNEMDGNFEDVTISTFKSGLLIEHGLRKSRTGKPVTNLRQLMDRIGNYKRVEEDQQMGKGNDKIIPHGEILMGSQDLLTLRWLMQCSENQCTRFLRRLRMSHSLNGQTRWLGTP